VPSPATLLGLLAGALLLAVYARGGSGWMLGFVALVPWLWVLDRSRSLAGTLAAGLAMTLALVVAGFSWFGLAIGHFTGLGPAVGLALLVLVAPLLQPQVLVWALLRRAVGRHHGPALGALAAAAGWVGTEWLLLKPLGDTLGHGLYPSTLLRQAADLGGTAGLTLLLLGVNEALHAALQGALTRRRHGLPVPAVALALPLLLAVVPPLLLAAYGQAVLGRLADPQAPLLRVGLIQANITDIETRRRSQGSYEVVRELLDTHFAMSYDAVERQRADAVLWSETVYPTTFGQPKSEAGADFDREIRTIVDAARVPFVFGTYDRDAGGEYNAAAVLEPGRGLVGFYRKTRLFPLTETVPAWLDGPVLQGLLPWAGRWQPGGGARVLPLRLRDGRDVPVQPLICRDSVDPSLAIAAARLGARALLTLSNDAWFGDDPLGAELHQAVAAFRSIETRLPQFRVTTNGFSAVIDATGAVRASGGMNERTLVVGALPVPEPPRTVMVAWGDWVGPALWVALLLALGAGPLARRLSAGGPAATGASLLTPVRVALLPAPARVAAATLRAVSRLALLGLGLALLLDDTLRSQTLQQLRLFGALVIAPEAAAACVLAAFRARVQLEAGELRFQRGGQQLALPLHELATLRPWRWPLPGPGLTVQLQAGGPWRYGAALRQPGALARAVANAGGPAAVPMPAFDAAREAVPTGLPGHPLVKFGLLPLVLALPAFHLHQHIAYGSAVGEWLSFGASAYALAFGLWWASWVVGVLLVAAVLRMGVEALAALGARWRPAWALPLRRGLERGALLLLYVGLPAWLLLRLSGLLP
jgi:apolipoprotein N-acyltransferase